MTSHPTLAQSAATLRAAVQSDRAPFWLPDSLHALIMACLLRIFGRLEQMIALWESGHLPPPQPRRAAARAITAPRPSNTRFKGCIAPVSLARRARKARDESNLTQPQVPVAASPPDAATPRRHASRAAIPRRAGRTSARAPPSSNTLKLKLPTSVIKVALSKQ